MLNNCIFQVAVILITWKCPALFFGCIFVVCNITTSDQVLPLPSFWHWIKHWTFLQYNDVWSNINQTFIMHFSSALLFSSIHTCRLKSIVASAKESMFTQLLVYLSVSRITHELVNKFWWNFLEGWLSEWAFLMAQSAHKGHYEPLINT